MSDVTSIRIHDKKGKQKFALENSYKSLCELTNFALDEYIKRFNAEQKNKGLMEEAFEAYKEHTKDDLVMETHPYTIALLKKVGIIPEKETLSPVPVGEKECSNCGWTDEDDGHCRNPIKRGCCPENPIDWKPQEQGQDKVKPGIYPDEGIGMVEIGPGTEHVLDALPYMISTNCNYPWDNDILSCPVCGKKHDK